MEEQERDCTPGTDSTAPDGCAAGTVAVAGPAAAVCTGPSAAPCSEVAEGAPLGSAPDSGPERGAGAAPYEPLPADIALAASALCEATSDDAKVAELLQRYWGMDEPMAVRAVSEARGRLLLVAHEKEPLSITGILELEDHSLSSLERYLETYLEENAEVIRNGVQGGGIKFVVNRVLQFLYKVFYKYIAVFVEPIIAFVLKLFPFIPL